jgi:hypothetical protein
MRKLDLDKMDEDGNEQDHRLHEVDDDYSERSIMDEDQFEDDDIGLGSSRREQRMSGVEETMFEMR